MSASQRSLARLPLTVFTNLQHDINTGGVTDTSLNDTCSNTLHEQDHNEQERFQEEYFQQSQQLSATELRTEICSKLKSVTIGSNGAGVNIHQKREVTTVGQILKLSPLALLRSLDPILTYGE